MGEPARAAPSLETCSSHSLEAKLDTSGASRENGAIFAKGHPTGPISGLVCWLERRGVWHSRALGRAMRGGDRLSGGGGRETRRGGGHRGEPAAPAGVWPG